MPLGSARTQSCCTPSIGLQKELGSKTVTIAQFNASDEPSNASALTRRFGSWQAALAKAGLTIAPLGKSHTHDDYFENLLGRLDHLGRQPYYERWTYHPPASPLRAMRRSSGTGATPSWAFIERVHASASVSAMSKPVASSRQTSATRQPTERVDTVDARSVPLGLRYMCSVVTASDACFAVPVPLRTWLVSCTSITFLPFSAGGKTTIDNLRTLCETATFGKVRNVKTTRAPNTALHLNCLQRPPSCLAPASGSR